MSTLGDLTMPKVDQTGPPRAGEFTYIDISSIDNRLKRIVEPKRLPASAAPSRAKQHLQPGDVLVSMTRPNLNAVAIVSPDLKGAIGSTGFHVLRAVDGIESRWLLYAVQTYDFVEAMSSLVQGALYPAVRPKDVRAFGIEAPPFDEQQRIVAEIEKQFSRLDEAVANLKRVKANLNRYKAAVLKAAVEGKLTEDWRKQNPDAELYVRMGMKAVPLDDNLQNPLPKSWACWNLKGISEKVSVGHVGPTSDYYCEKEQGIPFIRSQNVRPGKLDLEDVRYIQRSFHERLKKSRLRVGDLLVVRVGANRGDSCIVPPGFDHLNCANIVFARPFEGISRYLQLYFQSEPCQRTLLGLTTGSAQGVLNTKSVAEVPVPLPPLEEQDAIVAEVERRISVIDELEATAEANLTRADRLRQSILSQAFDGRLGKMPSSSATQS